MGQRRASLVAGHKNHIPKSQDQIDHSENYNYSSISVASIDEIKIQPSKDYGESHKPYVHMLFARGKQEKRSAEVVVQALVFKK